MTPKKSYRILIADDDASITLLLKRTLTGAGHHVTTCKDGQEASRTLEDQQYALLILDFHMPHMTGLEIIRERRQKGDKTPAILMSGGLHPADLEALGNLERVTCHEKLAFLADVTKAIDELAHTFEIKQTSQ